MQTKYIFYSFKSDCYIVDGLINLFAMQVQASIGAH